MEHWYQILCSATLKPYNDRQACCTLNQVENTKSISSDFIYVSTSQVPRFMAFANCRLHLDQISVLVSLNTAQVNLFTVN